MARDLEQDFDFVVLGTGLTESILAAALSIAGAKVLHLDPNPFYGSHEYVRFAPRIFLQVIC